jgi:hypothetical protein
MTYAAVDGANGNQFQNNGRMFLHVKNGAVSQITVTIAAQKAGVSDLEIAVPAGEERMIGPFAPGIYNDGDRLVQVSYSSGTSVTAALLRL